MYNVGDVMYDAVLFYRDIAVPTARVRDLAAEYGNGFYLATLHRAENTDDVGRLKSILRALDDISSRTPVIIPLHPRTLKRLREKGIKTSHLVILEPVGYFDMLTLLKFCRGVFTDSGGLQKESFFFGKPCITLREETEWVELVDHGFNCLAGADYERILNLEESFMHKDFDFSVSLYGDGRAGEKVVGILVNKL